MSGTTLVTCLIDLSRRDPARARDGAWYVERADTVLATRHALVAHVEPELVDVIADRRAALAPGVATSIVPTTFTDLPTARHVPAIERDFALGRRQKSASNLLKDTPDYLALGWSKPALLADAADRQTGSETLWWVDLALTAVAPEPEPGALDAVLDTRVTGLRATVLWETSADEYGDRGRFHRHNEVSRIAGGMFAVGRSQADRFAELFDEEIASCLDVGWPTIDECLLGIVIDRMREVTDLSYAPWEGLLSEIDGPDRTAWHRLRLLRDCRRRALDDRARLHAEALRAAHASGRIELTDAELAELAADL